MINRRTILATAACLAIGVSAAGAQTAWNLPAAYPAANPHTENLVAFAKDVETATGGKLKITVHAAASLFKAPEIKRAVATGQAQMGEVLLSIHENEDPLFGVDVVPFLAASFPEAMKLYKASKPAIEKKLAAQGLMLLFAVPWAPQGIYAKKDLELGRRHEGPEVARLQCRHHAHRRTGRRAVGDDPGGRTAAGARHRHRQLVHLVGRHGLRQQGLGVADALL